MAAIEHQEALVEWIARVRAEYREMPDLRLTRPQMQKLWRLDPVTCDAVIAALLDSHVLRRRRDGSYVALDS